MFDTLLVLSAFSLVYGMPLEELLRRMGDSSSLRERQLRAANEAKRLAADAALEARLGVDLPEGADPVAYTAGILLILIRAEMEVVAAAQRPDDPDDEPTPGGGSRKRRRPTVTVTAPLADLAMWAVALERVDRRTRGTADGQTRRCGVGGREPGAGLATALERFRPDVLLTRVLDQREEIYSAATMLLLDADRERRKEGCGPTVVERRTELRAVLRRAIDRALSHGDRERRAFNADFNRAVREALRGEGVAHATPSGWAITRLVAASEGILGAAFRLPATVRRLPRRSDLTSPWVLEVSDAHGTRRIAATETIAFTSTGDLTVRRSEALTLIPAGTWHEMLTRDLEAVALTGSAATVRIARRSRLARITREEQGREVAYLTDVDRTVLGRPWSIEELVRLSAASSLRGVQLAPGARVSRGKDAFVLFVERLIATDPSRCLRVSDARTICWMRSVWWTPATGAMGDLHVAGDEHVDEDDDAAGGGWSDPSPYRGVTAELDVLERLRDRVSERISRGDAPTAILTELGRDVELMAFSGHLASLGREGVEVAPPRLLRTLITTLRSRREPASIAFPQEPGEGLPGLGDDAHLLGDEVDLEDGGKPLHGRTTGARL